MLGPATDKQRRKFLVDSFRTSCAIGVAALTLGLYTRQSHSLPADAIRPPGAVSEADFLGRCIRCGLCVRDCPFDTLKLAEFGDDIAVGTPYFTARDIPCEMCEDIPCVKNCPTGALDKSLNDIDESRMGLAVLISQETCIAFQGLRCEVCYNICPLRDKAIKLELLHNVRSGKHAFFTPVVYSDACTGCGKCEKACVMQEAAIKIFPLHLAKGAPDPHYRLGWEEKQKAGGALVTPDTEHEYNLPEGMRYQHGDKGLIQKPEGQPPFANDPLDTLNQKGSL